jgi:putative flippase GtrA
VSAESKLRPARGDKRRFLLVGGAAFVLGSAILKLLIELGVSPYLAQIPVFAAAVTFTWALNRRYTFDAASKPTFREYFAYLVVSSGGLGTNVFFYTVSVALGCPPLLALAIGTICGMTVNFLGYDRMVFRR